jgi:hypothetical protein
MCAWHEPIPSYRRGGLAQLVNDRVAGKLNALHQDAPIVRAGRPQGDHLYPGRVLRKEARWGKTCGQIRTVRRSLPSLCERGYFVARPPSMKGAQ